MQKKSYKINPFLPHYGPMLSVMWLGSRIRCSLIHSTQISHCIRLILGGNHPLPLSNSLAVKPMHTPCYDWFPHSLNTAPKQQTWTQLVSWPPSHRVCLRH